MKLFEHTIWIAHPREAVFDYFTDFSNASRWRSYVRTMEVVGGGPPRAGSTVHVVMDLGGNEYTFDLQVLTCERPSLWRHHTNETDLTGAIEYAFVAEGDGTRVTMRCDAKPASVYGWLAVPLMFLRRGQAYKDQLPQLKRAMEES
ncbi:MAG TPA: SRPBCC family protein [Gemmatimonadaceae bacterium]|nr:SRPBCC family protein [Gemmatimonadaceae bacterium]